MDALPDFNELSDDDLEKLIEELERRESEVSYERRLLQGKIDILRTERVALKKASGVHVDVDRLSEILSRKASPEVE